MNMQAMMQQAQKIQRDMMKAKDEIEKKEYSSTQSFLTVKMMGNKQITEVKIDVDTLDKEDVEILEDLIKLAVNENIKNIEKETESKMGKFSGMSGLF